MAQFCFLMEKIHICVCVYIYRHNNIYKIKIMNSIVVQEVLKFISKKKI